MAQIEPSWLTLDEQLCFALYTASRAMTGCYRPILERIGLTYPQYLVMLVLWERGDIPVGRLGQALHLETGTLSPLLKRLESSGLIRRQRQQEDERSVLVGLTPAGAELRELAVAVPGQMAAATGIAPAEAVGLRDKLHALTERLRSPAAAERA